MRPGFECIPDALLPMYKHGMHVGCLQVKSTYILSILHNNSSSTLSFGQHECPSFTASMSVTLCRVKNRDSTTHAGILTIYFSVSVLKLETCLLRALESSQPTRPASESK